jgi:soluble lytic murein transglycosylase-like protein
MIRSLMLSVALVGASAVPMRCDPPSRSCDQYVPLLEEYAPRAGWDTSRMARIMWRESRCQPDAYNRAGRASGLLQVTPVNHPHLRAVLGEWVDRWTLTDPVQNVRAAAVLFDYWSDAGRSGYRPWSL